MDSQVIVKDANTLRIQFQSKPRLRLEFFGLMSNLLREHDVLIDDQLLNQLVPATTNELTNGIDFDKKNATSVIASQVDGLSDGSDMLSKILTNNPAAVLNVVMAGQPEARVLNLLLTPSASSIEKMKGPGPQPGTGNVKVLGPGPQPGTGNAQKESTPNNEVSSQSGMDTPKSTKS